MSSNRLGLELYPLAELAHELNEELVVDIIKTAKKAAVSYKLLNDEIKRRAGKVKLKSIANLMEVQACLYRLCWELVDDEPILHSTVEIMPEYGNHVSPELELYLDHTCRQAGATLTSVWSRMYEVEQHIAYYMQESGESYELRKAQNLLQVLTDVETVLRPLMRGNLER
jgi:hypothetical protein